jgi:aryl-alcohol dehydrogenase-like predicted oxidoreductase
MNKCVSKLGLGTAQWGMKYGVSNTQGQTPLEEVDKILRVAHSAGISLLDTASLYGNAEQILGQLDLSSFRVITKTPKFEKDLVSESDVENLVQTFFSSLQKLGLKSTYGVLFHNAEDIFAPNGAQLIDALERLKSQGLIEKIGVSVYDSCQIKKALNLFKPDIIQLPINVLDQRLIQDGTIAHLSGLGVEVHARSAFLQGLLLMGSSDRPPYFEPWAPLLSKWQRFCYDQFISPLQAALGFVCGLKDVSYALVGVQNQQQLTEILENSTAFNYSDFDQFASNDPKLLDPSVWSLA